MQQDEANRPKSGKTRSRTGKNPWVSPAQRPELTLQAAARVASARSNATKRSSALEARKSHTAGGARQLACAANGRDPFPGGKHGVLQSVNARSLSLRVLLCRFQGIRVGRPP